MDFLTRKLVLVVFITTTECGIISRGHISCSYLLCFILLKYNGIPYAIALSFTSLTQAFLRVRASIAIAPISYGSSVCPSVTARYRLETR